LYLSPYARRAVAQTGVVPNLDTMRNNLPQLPNSYTQGSLPAASYLDPKPLNDALAPAYFSALTWDNNQGGPVGALPFQPADPTTGNSVIGGLSINMQHKQYNFSAPVLSLPGRAGLNLSLGLSYSSRVWVDAAGVRAFNTERGFPAPGWRLGFGSLLFINPPTAWGYTSQVTGGFTLLYLAPSGARHELKYNATNGWYESYDGTYLSYDNATGILRTTDGTQLYFGAGSTSATARDFQAYVTKITDRNGNFINISYKTLSNEALVPDYVIDTAGRRIDFEYTGNKLTAIKQTRGSNTFYFARLGYTAVTVAAQTSNGQPVATDPANIGGTGTQVWVLNKITYPTGGNLRFGYNDDVQITNIEKWVPTVTGQGNERAVAGILMGGGTSRGQLGSARNEWAENWPGTPAGGWSGQAQMYSYSLGNEGTVVTTPTGQMYEAAVTATKLIHKTLGSNGQLKRNEMTYQMDGGVGYRSNPRVIESKITDYTQAVTTRRQTVSYLQAYGVWLPQQQSDYIGGGTTVYRRTELSYLHYEAQRIIGLPTVTSTFNGSDILLARTTTNYDETGNFTDSNNQTASYFINATGDNVIQHEASYGFGFTARGNATSVVQSHVANNGINGTRIVKRVSYDTNGNVRAETDGLGNRKQIVYTDNFSNKPAGVGNVQAYPYTTADPTGFRTGAQYDYYRGAGIKTFNLLPGGTTELQVMQTLYDFADRAYYTWRAADGHSVETRFWDNWLAVGTNELVEYTNNTPYYRFKWEIADGAGRSYRKASDHPDAVAGKYSGQIFVFDKVGREVDSSNVIAINGSFAAAYEDATPGFLFTHYDYDELNRLHLVTRPDNNHVTIDFTGCGCGGNTTKRITDEVGNYTETKTDWLGRLESATEPGTSTGVHSRAVYHYNELDQLTLIEHFDTTLVNKQERSFAYDGYGQLYWESTPEAGVATYNYYLNGLLFQRADARGVVATNSYNSRNLLTNMSYSDGTPGTSLTYDAYGARSVLANAEATTTYSYNSLRQLSNETQTFPGVTGKNFQLSYNYTLSDQVKTVQGDVVAGGSFTTPENALSRVRAAARITEPAAPRRPAAKAAARQPVKENDGTPLRSTQAVTFTANPNPIVVCDGTGLGITTLNWYAPGESLVQVREGSANGTILTSGGSSGSFTTGKTVTDGMVFYLMRPNSTTVLATVTVNVQTCSLTANPNPVQVCDGTGLGVTTLTWSAPGYANTQLRIGSPTGVLFTSGGATGSATTGKWVSNGTVFYLVDAATGATLATTTVAIWTENCVQANPTSFKVNYAYKASGALASLGTSLLGTNPNNASNVLNTTAFRATGAIKSLNYGNGL
jgi:hypothetical protein